MSDCLVLLPPVVTVIASLVASITDLLQHKVYNRLTIPLILTGLTYHSLMSRGQGFADSLLGAIIGLGILLLPWLMGGIGAGDVKLLAGVGAWLGAAHLLHVFIIAGLVGGGGRSSGCCYSEMA